jgi:hypothetical protein
MSQSLHVHVSVNVLHSSNTHWIQVLTFIPFIDLGLIIQITIAWLNHVWNDQNMPMAFNEMMSKHAHNSFVCFVCTQCSFYVFVPFTFQIFHMFWVYVLLWIVGYMLMLIFCFLFFNSNRWLNFDNHGWLMFLKPKTWSFHFTKWNLNMKLKLESNCMVFNDDVYGFIACYVPVLKALAKKSP